MTPRLLDLFCGAGGCSMGYHRAGFEVVGVDLHPQKRYPFEFHQADAIEFCREHAHEFDAIHASPPCQAYSALRHVTGREYVDLIPATRAALAASGKPYVIENVPGAPLGETGWLLLLCGTMFGLVTPDGRAEIRRHRLFECSWWFGLRPACQHGGAAQTMPHMAAHGQPGLSIARRAAREAPTVTGHSTHGAAYTSSRKALCVAGNSPDVRSGQRQDNGRRLPRRAMSVTGNTPQTNTARETFTVDDARAAMGIDWMPMKSLSQAIPPAYTEWIGRRLVEHLEMEPAA